VHLYDANLTISFNALALLKSTGFTNGSSMHTFNPKKLLCMLVPLSQSTEKLGTLPSNENSALLNQVNAYRSPSWPALE
jgi:hypothetical protein